jgi:hypothetical protein
MDPRLRAAVDASVAWYDDVFGLNGIPTRIEAGLWSALGPPIPWHSAAKTVAPGVDVERVVDAVTAYPRCTVADSFGDLGLDAHGFEVLFEATWLHHGADASHGDRLPDGWSVVTDARGLAEWSAAHDYVGVLPPAVLDHPRFRVLAHHRDGALLGGAVLHDGPGVVGLSNAWDVGETAFDQVLAVVAALHPGRAVTDFARGAEQQAMLEAGFAPLGPQRVWIT